MQWFRFCLPIGWDELSATATAIAVIIAVFANLNSNKQLKKALQMHEQSKNIALFDRRLTLIENVKHNEPISWTELQLLFNKEVCEAMRAYYESHEQLKKNRADEHNFWYFFDEKYKFTPEKDILRQKLVADGKALLRARSKGSSSLKMEDDFRNLCEENIMEWTPSLGKSKNSLNYYSIFFDLERAKEISNERKLAVISKMEEHISNSIKPIS